MPRGAAVKPAKTGGNTGIAQPARPAVPSAKGGVAVPAASKKQPMGFKK